MNETTITRQRDNKTANEKEATSHTLASPEKSRASRNIKKDLLNNLQNK